jgi:acyl-CoA synthetase (AMP-forming)/AMP-acid ligase II
MRGQMQDQPLLVSAILRHADRHHGDTEIVSRSVEGPIHRVSFRDTHARARRLANAFRRLGIAQGDRVATLAWNGYRHVEIYFAASGLGAVCHTVNPRLFREQIAYILNHAADSVVLFNLTFAPLVEALRPQCPSVKSWIAMTDTAHMESAPEASLCYETLLDAETDALEWPSFDEGTASSLCYTSGTTGNPKGVLYSHRSTMLHAFGTALPDSFCLSAREVVMPVVPMFHVNAWGLPYSAMMVGAKLVMPGAALDGKSLYELFESEQVTFSAGVPTVWLGLSQFLEESGQRLSSLKRIVCGGSAIPPAMMRDFEEKHGVRMVHAWGMTEMSPIGTIGNLKAKHGTLDDDARFALGTKQGRVPFGVDVKIVDGDGRELPWDGVAFGDLLVRGPWVASAYYKEPGSPLREDWFPTGDVATIDADGYVQITDRSKDVIKSGGEWISSIELENIAVAHPAVAEAAVIGVKHPKWDERPLLIVQCRDGAAVSRDELLAFYAGKAPKWWIPDDVAFVDSLPHTATGKLLKLQLRRDFADYRLPGDRA